MPSDAPSLHALIDRLQRMPQAEVADILSRLTDEQRLKARMFLPAKRADGAAPFAAGRVSPWLVDFLNDRANRTEAAHDALLACVERFPVAPPSIAAARESAGFFGRLRGLISARRADV